jgi:hypothetical protein
VAQEKDEIMKPETLENLIAELAALATANQRALSAVAHLSGDPRRFLSEVLESGLRDLESATFYDFSEDRRPLVLEKARARYSKLLGGIQTA